MALCRASAGVGEARQGRGLRPAALPGSYKKCGSYSFCGCTGARALPPPPHDGCGGAPTGATKLVSGHCCTGVPVIGYENLTRTAATDPARTDRVRKHLGPRLAQGGRRMRRQRHPIEGHCIGGGSWTTAPTVGFAPRCRDALPAMPAARPAFGSGVQRKTLDVSRWERYVRVGIFVDGFRALKRGGAGDA